MLTIHLIIFLTAVVSFIEIRLIVVPEPEMAICEGVAHGGGGYLLMEKKGNFVEKGIQWSK